MIYFFASGHVQEIFSDTNMCAEYFFPKSPKPPLKSKMVHPSPCCVFGGSLSTFVECFVVESVRDELVCILTGCFLSSFSAISWKQNIGTQILLLLLEISFI